MKELLQTQKAFSPTTQAFYDLSFDYPDLPDDLIELNEDTYQDLLTKLNQGCHINADLSVSEPRPSLHHIWQDGDWVLGVDKAVLQSQIWEAIKQKRHAITRGGVYVPSVKKWFHSDESSRTQYLAMQIMPELPDDLMWKTMDGSFIRLTKEILMQLAMTMMTQEQSDFANAERHRQLMLKVENPLEYDYSSGWSAVYGDKEHSND